MKIPWLIARQSLTTLRSEKTIGLLMALFIALIMVSAYLGWSATTTMNAIYLKASIFLATSGQPIPANPVLDISPLSLLRNMTVYVLLIGALAAIVTGYQLVTMDRKNGVLPLIHVRPLHRLDYGLGKLLALGSVILALTMLTALISIVTLLMLPTGPLDTGQWLHLGEFFVLSGLYMLMFGLLALASSAYIRSESVGLLLPVIIWLTITFILPAITANIHPTAVLNPVSVLASPPDTYIFRTMHTLLGPASLAQAYSVLAASLLDILPPHMSSMPRWPEGLSFLFALMLSGGLAIHALLQLQNPRGDYHA